MGVIEVGHLCYSPALQRTATATEAMYLMMRHAFEDLGYRHETRHLVVFVGGRQLYGPRGGRGVLFRGGPAAVVPQQAIESRGLGSPWTR